MNINSYAKKIPYADDVLNYMGLQRRDSTMVFQAVGLLTGGVILGLAAGLLLAPKPGAELRNDLLKQGGKLREQFRQQMETTGGKAARLLSGGTEPHHNGDDNVRKTETSSAH